MRFYDYPLIGKLIFSKARTRFQNAKGKIFLTFDDGPHPDVTPLVLDILKNYNAKATFFCLGEYVKLYQGIYNNILENGHTVGTHGYSHINGIKCSLTEYIENIDRAAQYINSNIFRPPYGKMTPRQYRWVAKHYKIVLWDILSYDFDDKLSVEEIVKIVISRTKDGSIIVFHDSLNSKQKILQALPQILEHFKGFECCSIQI
jgi:peptidoglycan-N-acetylglucosamine deacetylase